ncbi:hypothetical protein B0H19DRAFT_1251199 [Mycena capillaripes]|nr:hypothetical protein B0H19DRAFT_1251199 [Mycena capillaripes]
MDFVEAHPAKITLHSACVGNFLPYTGITERVACAARAENDLKAGHAVMIINFLESNEDFSIETFHIPGLNTPTFSEHDLRLNLIPSQKECIRALPTTLHPTPLGVDVDPELQQRLQLNLVDELRVLAPLDTLMINPKVMNMVHKKLTDILRKSNGQLVKLEVTQDIPRGAFLGKVDGYWDTITGRGPKEERHLRQMTRSNIPQDGDLGREVLAQCIGLSVDFWRLDLQHSRYYWLHVTLMSRLLNITNPLFIVTHSNPVAAVFCSGDLVQCWRSLAPSTMVRVLAGQTPSTTIEELPKDTIPHQYCGDAFSRSLGSLQIIQTTADPTQLALHLVRSDMGQLKYDQILAHLQWAVSDAAWVKMWLEDLKAMAEQCLEVASVTDALEKAKTALRRREVVVNFLRSLVCAPPKSYKHTVRKERLKAAPAGAERQAQLESLVQRASELELLGLPIDPDYISPVYAPIGSDAFDKWLHSLSNGTDLAQSARSGGRSAQGVANADASHKAIAQWNRDNVDHDAIARQNLQKVLADVGRVGTEIYEIAELQYSWRMVHCSRCDSCHIANHNVAYHRCGDALNDEDDLTLTEANYPAIERVLYAHDVLHEESLVEPHGSLDDILLHSALVAVPALPILKLPQNCVALSKVLRRPDLTVFDKIMATVSALGDIYIPEDRLDDDAFQLTLAFDLLLKQHNQCPPNRLPVAAPHRRAWKLEDGIMMESWIKTNSTSLYIVMAPRQRKGQRQRKGTAPAETAAPAKTRGSGGSIPPEHSHSVTSRVTKVPGVSFASTIFHLPEHYARRLWFGLCIETKRPEKRDSKMKKAEWPAATTSGTVVKGGKSVDKAGWKQTGLSLYFG